MRKFVTALALAASTLCIAPSLSHAQEWPQRPIRMIVPFPAGGGTDFVARLVAKYLGEKLKQTIVVENRGGANGSIGLQALKQASADGYTIAATSDSPLTVNPWLYKNLSYDPMRDFIPVATLVRLPGMLAVHPSVPVHSVAELITLAKSKPGGLAYASAGVGNFSHLAMELFAQSAGVKLLHVPYKGTGPSGMALLAGDVQISFNNVQTLMPYVEANKLTPLGVGEPKRMSELPNLPTIAETVPGFEMAPWVGIVAPAGTPKEIIARLSEATLAVMNDPALIKQCVDQHLVVMALPPDNFTRLIAHDLDKWGKVTKSAGITME
jgi:tripartite-type tricarboxylate transporter receptor subunit TctC